MQRVRWGFEALVSIAAVAVGLAWALPATAIGLVAGFVLTYYGGGGMMRFGNGLAHTMFQPGASEAERSQPLVPRAVGTVWLLGVAAACAYVAYEVEHGNLGDTHGYAFLPLALPWLALVVTYVYRVAMREVRPSAQPAAGLKAGSN